MLNIEIFHTLTLFSHSKLGHVTNIFMKILYAYILKEFVICYDYYRQWYDEYEQKHGHIVALNI